MVFSRKEGDLDKGYTFLPCGRCVHCRLRRASEWGIRCCKEATFYQHNHFLTLTYNDSHLPNPDFIDPTRITKFMKDLRKRYGEGIRSFGCAEYGTKNLRPHYHLLIFNSPFTDLTPLSSSSNLLHQLYSSSKLTELWPEGLTSIGDLTFESAAYVARYHVKAQRRPDDIREFITQDGEVLEYPPPQPAGLSRRPGIGRAWAEKYIEQLFRDDYIIQDGRRFPIPKFFDKIMEKHDPIRFEALKAKRRALGEESKREMQKEYEAERLKKLILTEEYSYTMHPEHVREIVHETKAKQLERKL